jgi:N-acetylneuraminic acid mutarotase
MNCPPPRDEHSAVVYERYMYVFGGYIGSEPTNSFFVYDINFKMWRKVSSIKYMLSEKPCPRAGHSAVTVVNFMYLFGGRDANKNKLNDLWRFNFRFDFWE